MLTKSELDECERNPVVLRALSDYHDCKATEAAAIGDMEMSVEFHETRAHWLRGEADRIEREY